jgi:uncharacterized protein with gpF-like domain
VVSTSTSRQSYNRNINTTIMQGVRENKPASLYLKEMKARVFLWAFMVELKVGEVSQA